MTFRLYYNGDKLDPDLPPPTPAVPIMVPTQRPSASGDSGHFIYPNGSTTGAAGIMPNPIVPQNVGAAAVKAESMTDATSPVDAGPAEDRQSTLKEVRDHLEILKQFEGIIPVDEINRRKRELFLALPPAPPPQSAGKRHKL